MAWKTGWVPESHISHILGSGRGELLSEEGHLDRASFFLCRAAELTVIEDQGIHQLWDQFP